MQIFATISTGLVITVLGTVLAIRLDRWLLRGKVKADKLLAEKEKLLGEIRRMQDFVDDLLQILDSGTNPYTKRDRFERLWKPLEKIIPEKEKAALNAEFQNAHSAIGMGLGSATHAKERLRAFQNELGNLVRRLEIERAKHEK